MTSATFAFREGRSIFHRMDPVSKFFFVLCISIVSFVNNEVWLAFVLLAISAVAALLFAGTPFRAYWALGKGIMPFVIAVTVVYPFLYVRHLGGGEADVVAIHTPIRDVTWQGITYGSLLGLRFVTLAFVGLMFAFTTHPNDIIQSVSKRGIDYRLVHAAVIGLVFLPVFLGYAQDISVAQKIRDLGTHSNRVSRYFLRLKHLFFAMLVLGLKKAQITATSLEIRGFGASNRRTFLRPLHEPLWGKVVGYASVAVSIGVVILRMGTFFQTLFLRR
jgi:energy-coupling factor transport system permease protein